MIDKLYTVEEVANLASVTPRTIRNYLKSGKLVGRKIGGQWRFSEAEVQKLLSGEEAEVIEHPAQEQHIFSEHPEAEVYHEEEEIYRDPFPIIHTDEEHNIIEFNPETSYAPENYEAKIPTDYEKQRIEAAEQPARLPYTMPVREKPANNLSGANNISEPPHHNPAFPNLNNPTVQNPYETVAAAPPAQPYQPAPASPYGAQVPGNPQINYFPGQMPLQNMYPPNMQPPNMQQPMYYSSPMNFGTPVMQMQTPYMNTAYPPPYPQQQVYPQNPTPPPTVPNISEKNITEDKVAEAEYKPTDKPKKVEKEQQEQHSDKNFPFELSDIGYQVALFASEVHDCSQGPQVCTMIDLHQSLASAKITSERLMEIAEQETELGTACHCYVEFDTRYYIARYTLFGTSEFLFRCLKLLG